MFAFCIFDAKEIPLDADQCQLYGNHDLKLLITKFNVISAEQILKAVNNYQMLKDRMTMLEFGMLLHFAAKKDEILRETFHELVQLCCVVLSIPLATVSIPQSGQIENF